MIKKYYIHMITIILFLGMVSCDKWLDVVPESQIRAEELFKTENGFKEALFGVYTSMNQRNLYGGNMSMGFVDVLAQNYVITSVDHPFYYSSLYSYNEQNVENRTKGIWSSAYTAIANCNNVLENAEGKENLFQNDDFDILNGEALAIRAFLHFDLLRLFAPSFQNGEDQLSIPYADKLSNTAFPQLTLAEAMQRINDDLILARQLLENTDPIGPAFEEYNDDEYDNTDVIYNRGFLQKRKNRLNYYAVTSLLARTHLYMGLRTEAANFAFEVINSGKFSLVSENENPLFYDPIFYDEVIFGLYKDEIQDINRNFFANNSGNGLAIPTERRNRYFEVHSFGVIDTRLRQQFYLPEQGVEQVLAKFTNLRNTIPLIKLAEMYYILAECTADPEEAVEYLNVVRRARGYEVDLGANAPLAEEIQKEYRKEFLGEGQFFYYLKRNDIQEIPYSSAQGTNAVYVLPLPDLEIEFGLINN